MSARPRLRRTSRCARTDVRRGQAPSTSRPIRSAEMHRAPAAAAMTMRALRDIAWILHDRRVTRLAQQKADAAVHPRWLSSPKIPPRSARRAGGAGEADTYYIIPRPTRWRRYVREGVRSGNGSRRRPVQRAIVAKDPPTAAEDPNWIDAAYSVVRWAAASCATRRSEQVGPAHGETVTAR